MGRRIDYSGTRCILVGCSWRTVLRVGEQTKVVFRRESSEQVQVTRQCQADCPRAGSARPVRWGMAGKSFEMKQRCWAHKIAETREMVPKNKGGLTEGEDEKNTVGVMRQTCDRQLRGGKGRTGGKRTWKGRGGAKQTGMRDLPRPEAAVAAGRQGPCGARIGSAPVSQGVQRRRVGMTGQQRRPPRWGSAESPAGCRGQSMRGRQVGRSDQVTCPPLNVRLCATRRALRW